MAWRDTLLQIREELADLRAKRRTQVEADQAEIDRQREELTQLAGTLGITQVLEEMNATLLDGKGAIERMVSWEPDDEDEEPMLDDDVEEEADVITGILTWEEGGELELAVDLGISDEGTYLQVNGIDIRPEREALEQALVEGFRDELNL
jgi:hypothetical protein